MTTAFRTAALRTPCRMLFGIAALVAGAAAPSVPALARTAAGASPLVAVASVFAARAMTAGAAMGLALAVASVLRKRFFCRWLCPVGLLTEWADRGGRARGPGRFFRAGSWPAFGIWLALATLGGALLGRPLLLWLDPVSLWMAAAGAVEGPGVVAARAALAGLAVIVLSSLLVPGLWCARLCPLGGFQDALAMRPRGRSSRAGTAAGPGWARRDVLRLGAGALATAAGAHALARAPMCRRPAAAAAVRPPGALDEPRFGSVCVRCGNCVRACPSAVIVPDPAPMSVAGFRAPALRFSRDYCREDCNRCSMACPSGAIARWDLTEKPRIACGLARVEFRWCLLAEDRECDICRRVCPFDAVRFEWNAQTYSRVPVIDADRCTGCGACEARCPGLPGPGEGAAGDKAIQVAARRARLPARTGVAPTPAVSEAATVSGGEG